MTVRSIAHTRTPLVEKGAQIIGLGRSRGGSSTKIHLMVDALSSPLDFEMTEGQVHDVTQAAGLIERNPAGTVLADKGNYSNDVRGLIEAKGSTSVIPNRQNRKLPPRFDKDMYKARSGIELTFNRLKQWRRRVVAVITKYDEARETLKRMRLAVPPVKIRERDKGPPEDKQLKLAV